MEMHGSPRWEWHGRDQRMLSYLHLYSGSETINSLSSEPRGGLWQSYQHRGYEKDITFAIQFHAERAPVDA
jgi:hypothetical protein